MVTATVRDLRIQEIKRRVYNARRGWSSGVEFMTNALEDVQFLLAQLEKADRNGQRARTNHE
jgi:hypothetical protein